MATSERVLLLQKATGVQSSLEEARANLQSLKEGGEGKHNEYGALKKEAAKVKKSLAESEEKLEVSNAQIKKSQINDDQSMSARSDQLRHKVSTARQKADEAKSSLAADKSENAVLSSLNKLKAQGRIKGFHVSVGMQIGFQD